MVFAQYKKIAFLCSVLGRTDNHYCPELPSTGPSRGWWVNGRTQRGRKWRRPGERGLDGRWRGRPHLGAARKTIPNAEWRPSHEWRHPSGSGERCCRHDCFFLTARGMRWWRHFSQRPETFQWRNLRALSHLRGQGFR